MRVLVEVADVELEVEGVLSCDVAGSFSYHCCRLSVLFVWIGDWQWEFTMHMYIYFSISDI